MVCGPNPNWCASGWQSANSGNRGKTEAAGRVMTSKWRTIGDVCVDTATIVICDPCQADDVFSDNEYFDATDNNNQAGELRNDHDCPVAVALRTGIGDGRYKVEARYETNPDFGKRIAEIRIKFLPHPM